MPNVDLTIVEIGMLKVCIDTTLDTIDYPEAERNRALELKQKLDSYL